MKHFLLLIVASLSLHSALAQPAEDGKLQAFFKNYLDQQFALKPTDATGLGDHRFDAQLDDISPAAREHWRAFAKDTLAALPKQVAYKRLSRDGQIDYEIFQHQLEAQLWLTDNMRPFEKDPRTYGGYLSDSVYTLLAQSTQPKETNVANAIARMAQMPKIVEEAKRSLTHPAKPILETAIRQNTGAISFYQDDIFKLAGDTAQKEQLSAGAAKTVALLKDYQTFLEGPARSRAEDNWRLGTREVRQEI